MPRSPGCGLGFMIQDPDPREDLESRSPNLGPYTTKGTLQEPPLRDLLFGSSRGSGDLGFSGYRVQGFWFYTQIHIHMHMHPSLHLCVSS